MATLTQRGAAAILTVASLVGLVISLYYYVVPITGVTGTPGALLVVVSSMLLVIAGIILFLRDSGWFALTVRILAVVGSLGTIAAAYLLHEFWLMAVMILAFFAATADFASKKGAR